MDVTLDGADHHLADLGRARLGQERTQHMHAGLHRIGGHQHFRHEQDAVAEIDADDAHALDQRLVQHFLGRPAALEQDTRPLLDLRAHTVIEVVVHLLDQLGVVERRQVEIVTIGHARTSFSE